MTVAIPTPAPDQHRTLFDALKNEDENGEWWSARDLMPLYGYGRWDKFSTIIERAITACGRSGNSVSSNFVPTKFVDKARHRKPDFQLTRYAAYLVAMEGDPSKTEIAQAKTYFAVQTRRAEVVLDGLDTDFSVMVQQIAEMQRLRNDQRRLRIEQDAQRDRLDHHGRQINETRAQVEEAQQALDDARQALVVTQREAERVKREMADLVERLSDVEHTTPLKDNTRLHSMKEAAQLLEYGQNDFHKLCRDLGVIYPDPEGGYKIYQRYMNEGWGEARWLEWPNGKGHSWVVRLTGKGIIKIKRMIEEGRLF